MSHIGEFELIRRISAAVNASQSANLPGTTGIGDDCAIIPQQAGLDTLVTTDLLIEGRHFLLDDVSPWQLGWKSAAVNISDIAAMGGRPTAAFLSIALPKGLAERTVDSGLSPGAVPLKSVADAPPPTPWAPPAPSRGRQCFPEGQLLTKALDGSDDSSDVSLLADSAPEDPPIWIDEFIRGFNAVCARYGVALLGGDTSASPSELFINVTVMGECAHGAAIRRDGARPGDLICVTGPLGDSATGLKLVLERNADESRARPSSVRLVCKNSDRVTAKSGQNAVSPPFEKQGNRTSADVGTEEEAAGIESSDVTEAEVALIRRHYLPEPRVKEGMALAAVPGVHSMMDISDGIASDLRHILKASGVGATIDVAKLPISNEMRLVCEERGWDPAELAVGGGEDYELLLTIAPESLEKAQEALAGRLTVIGSVIALTDIGPAAGLTDVGTVTDRRATDSASASLIRWLGTDKEYQGFTHEI